MRAAGGLAAALLAVATAAPAADYRIERAGSSVTFSAMQQGARFPGSFDRFGGSVSFDPATATGRIDATVEVGSVDSGNPERDGVLRTPDWFDVARFPAARFVAVSFRRTASGFVAAGELTLRDVGRPATLAFRFTPPDGSGRARLQGTLAVQRLDFGIGRGEWTDTTYVGNDVAVAVDVRLAPAAPGTPAGAGKDRTNP